MQTSTSNNTRLVLLGLYSTDPLEKEFGKIRQGSGGTYFLSVQQVLEKLDIQKTKLLLKLNADVDNLDVNHGHECEKCEFLLDNTSSKTFDHLNELEDRIPKETKISLVHMAGYVTRHDKELDEIESLETTTFYFDKYGSFTKSLDRGGLKIPTDSACQWTFFCFIMFNLVKDQVCRKSLTDLFIQISEVHDFGMKEHHGKILSNIFFKNYCLQETPISSKEPKQKVLKLSLEY